MFPKGICPDAPGKAFSLLNSASRATTKVSDPEPPGLPPRAARPRRGGSARGQGDVSPRANQRRPGPKVPHPEGLAGLRGSGSGSRLASAECLVEFAVLGNVDKIWGKPAGLSFQGERTTKMEANQDSSTITGFFPVEKSTRKADIRTFPKTWKPRCLREFSAKAQGDFRGGRASSPALRKGTPRTAKSSQALRAETLRGLGMGSRILSTSPYRDASFSAERAVQCPPPATFRFYP